MYDVPISAIHSNATFIEANNIFLSSVPEYTCIITYITINASIMLINIESNIISVNAAATYTIIHTIHLALLLSALKNILQ